MYDMISPFKSLWRVLVCHFGDTYEVILLKSSTINRLFMVFSANKYLN